MRRTYVPLLALLLFFIVIRLLIIFSGADNFVVDVELFVGTVARMLIDGISLGFIFSCFPNIHLGAVVAGILTVPFFLLFGDNLVVLRLVATFFSSGTLILLYLFLHKFFNKKMAILGGLLFMLSPPNYIKMTFVRGCYVDTNFFSILAFFVFCRIFFAGGNNRRHLYAFFGLVCGFALFYDYVFLLTLSCCLLCWFIFDKGMFIRKKFYIFLSFFLIGFSPWFYYNVTHHWNALFIINDRPFITLFTKNSFSGSLNQLKDFVTFVIPSYFGFKGLFFVSQAIISHIYYFMLAVSVTGFFWLQRRSIARFFSGMIPLRRLNISPGMISPEILLFAYLILFGLAYATCGFSQFSGKGRYAAEDEIAFPQRLVTFIIPHIFMLTSIFLVRISTHRYGARVAKMFICVLLSIGLIGNLSMISMQRYTINNLPEGYNYLFAGRLFIEKYGDDIKQSLGYVKIIDAGHRQLFYDGHKWAIPKITQGFSIRKHVQKNITEGIAQDYRPLAYEYLGKALGGFRYGKSADEELKSCADQAYYPYFYRGLGRGFAGQGVDKGPYAYMLGVIDTQYRRFFHEGMGIEMDVIFADSPERFIRFMSALDTEVKIDIYRGFAQGREYSRANYDTLRPGFGKILPSMQKWRKRIDVIEEEFRPYCYQRLGIEAGWRFIYGMKEKLRFLQKTDKKYRADVYRGLGMGIGWRFGHNIKGCVLLIEQTEQRYWAYLYEGLGAGVVKRYGYSLDERTREIEIEKVPAEYRRQFREGLEE